MCCVLHVGIQQFSAALIFPSRKKRQDSSDPTNEVSICTMIFCMSYESLSMPIACQCISWSDDWRLWYNNLFGYNSVSKLMSIRVHLAALNFTIASSNIKSFSASELCIIWDL